MGTSVVGADAPCAGAGSAAASAEAAPAAPAAATFHAPAVTARAASPATAPPPAAAASADATAVAAPPPNCVPSAAGRQTSCACRDPRTKGQAATAAKGWATRQWAATAAGWRAAPQPLPNVPSQPPRSLARQNKPPLGPPPRGLQQRGTKPGASGGSADGERRRHDGCAVRGICGSQCTCEQPHLDG